VRIDIPAQLLAWRARSAAAGRLPRGYSLLFPLAGWVLAARGRFAFAARWARRVQRVVPAAWLRGKWNPWTRPGRALPVLSDETFREWTERTGKRR
jgi:hypothetical protein